MVKVGDKIKISELGGKADSASAYFDGAEGIVTEVKTDSYGVPYYKGTWGDLVIYPELDKFEILETSDPEVSDLKTNSKPEKQILTELEEAIDPSSLIKILSTIIATISAAYNSLSDSDKDKIKSLCQKIIDKVSGKLITEDVLSDEATDTFLTDLTKSFTVDSGVAYTEFEEERDAAISKLCMHYREVSAEPYSDGWKISFSDLRS